MLRAIALLIFVSFTFQLRGQEASAYAEQIEAIQRLLRSGQFTKARKQAEGLVKLGQSSLLTSVEAEAQLLIARSYLDDPDVSGRKQMKAIKALRESAKLFSRERDAESVNRVLAELSELLGESVTLNELHDDNRNRKRPKLRRNDSLLIEKELLDALVSSQEATINELSESQVMQMLKLQQQQALLDSFSISALEDSLLVVKQSMRIEAQNATLQSQEQQRKLLLVIGAAILAILGVLYWRFLASQRYQRVLQEKNDSIDQAREESDALLRNILPASVAIELKQNGKAKAQRHPEVSVLFADFKGFSKLAGSLEADEVVRILDDAFQTLDKISRKFGLEKIKTIGDAYMAACGLPEYTEDHAERIVEAALEMQFELQRHEHFSARIGIHSGPVVAGVVGLDKFAYDIWGDTVNRAARLEAASDVNRVNISLETKQLLPKGKYVFESRGSVEVKNIGAIEMFFVSRNGS